MQGNPSFVCGEAGWVNTKHVQRILNKMIPGNRCLAGSECSQAACVDERTELRAGGEDKSDKGWSQIVEDQALVFGFCSKFPGRRPGED